MAEQEPTTTESMDGTMAVDNETLLVLLNDQKALDLLPVTIYLVVLILLGVVGNTMAIYIYYAKFKKTPSNYFVIWLAVLDLLSCFLAMPFDIIDMTRPYLFDSPVSCKTVRFIQSATLLTPAMTIIVIAIDRHDKVFRPFKRMSNTKAKIINGVTLGVAVCLAMPAFFVFGRNTVPTSVPGINGITCSVDDSARGKIHPYVYYAILFLVFLLTVVLLAVFYGRLWREIRHRSAVTARKSCPRGTESADREGESHELETSTSMSTSSPKKHYFKAVTSPAAQTEAKTSPSGLGAVTTGVTSIQPRHSVKVYGAAGKTTKIVFVVSMAFVLSFLPYLIAKIVQVTVADVEDFPSVGVEVIYNIATRSFFINNAINPFIYLYLNSAFRREANKLVSRLCCRK